jgi:hypothetical protein
VLDQLTGQGVKLCFKAASLSRYTSTIKAWRSHTPRLLMAHCCTVHRRPARLSRAASYCDNKVASIVHLFHPFMFTYSATRTSAAVQFLHVDLLRGVATVEFKNGHMYEYKNVSRRAIASLMANPNMSLGFWVNANCVDTVRTSCKVVPDYVFG